MPKTQLLNDAMVCPEVALRTRVQEIFLLPDCSSSMWPKKIAIANQAIRENIAELLQVAEQHPEVEYRLRVIAFSDSARWHIGPDPAKITDVAWQDLKANGATSTGVAVQMLADAVSPERMPKRGLPPVMVLMSDGGNTDGRAYEDAITKLEKEPWGAKAVRLAIGIGKGYDHGQLEKFTNRPDVGVLEARNAVDLKNYIEYATVTVPIGTSIPRSVPAHPSNNVYLPEPPAPVTDSTGIKLEVF